ncbi:hypothetical protein [Micromonospora sp. NBC_01796]|uniref:hypothetical protein n=1 Tax=Micromonospora sp. NBC_01796 TaxID=2975987 RepID=UPI002DDB7DA5|nr:hypothetical protein [Micromonospora sp. NBC_01796]WSA86643.1 hypothetical protein OIE47_03195 [Micromonospora sp. NBC_01796]
MTITERAGEKPVSLSPEQRERLRRLLVDELRAAIVEGPPAVAPGTDLDERRRALDGLRQGDDDPACGDHGPLGGDDGPLGVSDDPLDGDNVGP